MSTIVTRAGKGSPLTNNEVDANFTNLNTDKLESADLSGYALLTGATFTGDVEGTEFIGSLRGNNIFKAQAGEALSKGDALYISGISGNTPIVSLADADNAAKIPAFGVAADNATLNSAVDVVTYGAISGVDTSGFTLGDTLYVGTTSGQLVNTPPTGESSLIQNLGKVERVHASAGILFIAGAGRANALPNLNDGKFFLGNGSNQAVSVDFATSVTDAGALMKSGGTMSGNIDCDGNKVLFSNVYSAVGDLPSATDNHGMFAHVHATGKGYFAHAGSWIVLANDTEKLSLTGGTMSGEIAMGTFKITGVGNPSAAQDVATKDYVDNNAGGGAQSVTPTVSLGSNSRDVTITNYSSYINPVFVGTIGGVSSVWTVVSAGVIRPDDGSATGSATIKVREAGLLESDASSAVTIGQTTRHRYWRLTNFTGGTSQESGGNYIRHINFYSNAAGTIKNGNYATRTASYSYSSSYLPSNTATDNSSGWWSLGNASGDRAGTGTWLTLDNGSAPTVESVCIRLDCNVSFMATAFDLQFSDDNTNWTTYMNISGSDISDSNLVIDL